MLPLQIKMTCLSALMFLVCDCLREVSCDILLYPAVGEQDRFYSNGGQGWEHSMGRPWW